VLRDAFARHGGIEVDTQGDAFFVAFQRASAALAAAGDMQTAPTIEWSYELLDDVAKPVDEERFLMLETIGEYAAERLEASGEAGDVRARHAERFWPLSPGRVQRGSLVRRKERSRSTAWSGSTTTSAPPSTGSATSETVAGRSRSRTAVLDFPERPRPRG
jgi:hypothetical protein